MHFAQRVRALVVLNGVALLPQFACKQGLANGELVRRTVERHTQTVVCFICGAKGDARHCAIFYG
ncbi:hypothetical protein ExPECSC028_00294 [Escherichia coli]|nr:hypothetical protein ExPECSC028_00294 [Escherichia coli]